MPTPHAFFAWVFVLSLSCTGLAACGGGGGGNPDDGAGSGGGKAGEPGSDDAGIDAGHDAAIGGGHDAGTDAATELDAGRDASVVDAGRDAGADAAVPVDAGDDAGDAGDAAMPMCTDAECDLFDNECGDFTCNHDTGRCDVAAVTSGTLCGQQNVTCRVDDTCDGLGHCSDNGWSAPGTICGVAPAECQLAPKCDAFGDCVPGGPSALGASCGSASTGACDAADSCDGSGTCKTNHVAMGTSCSTQSLACENDDTCDANGVCVDQGFVMGCAITTQGSVVDQYTNQPIVGVTVTALGQGGIAPVQTDANGVFELDLPAGVPVVLHAAPSTGRYGVAQAVYVTPSAQGMPRLSVAPDSDAMAISTVPGADPIDFNLGLAIVRLDQSVGGESVSIGASSSAPISFNNMGVPTLSSSIQSTANPFVIFTNVALGTTTVTAPGLSQVTECTMAYPALSPWPILMHTVTHVRFACVGL